VLRLARHDHSHRGFAVQSAIPDGQIRNSPATACLRHTAASLAVSAGANVKAVQRMLGHASAALTLDRCADLFDDDLDAVADRLDVVARTVRGHLADYLRTAGPNVYSLNGEDSAVGQ
jgi:hypothetical protein